MPKSPRTPAPRRRGRLGALLATVAAGLVAVALAVAAIGWFAANRAFTAPGPATADGAPRIVMIERGSSVAAIAAALDAAGAIEHPLPFRAAVRALRAESDLKAGEYAIPSGASLSDIIALLREGDVILHPVTIPEGLTTAQILRRIEAEPALEGPMPETPPAEGVLLPDTYMVERGETREQLIQRMIRARETTLAELWAARQPGLPLETPEEAVILASIVEKETGLPEERPAVAAVFVNRLRRGMRLESDPTIIYGLTGGEPLGRGLYRSELLRENPYSTYQIAGLPPTPICNPGRASLEAVLDPPSSEYLFFVADGSGGHAFSRTYAEHLVHVANLREREREAAAQQGRP